MSSWPAARVTTQQESRKDRSMNTEVPVLIGTGGTGRRSAAARAPENTSCWPGYSQDNLAANPVQAAGHNIRTQHVDVFAREPVMSRSLGVIPLWAAGFMATAIYVLPGAERPFGAGDNLF
jgi:hypothetical protein